MVGSDPEFFLKKDGNFIPAIGLVGGNKHNVRDIGFGGLLEDNVMVEFNIPPATSAEEFSSNLERVLSFIKEELAEYEFAYVPSADFPLELLQSPQAKEFGCEPDYNAYSLQMNIAPDPMQLGGLRFAGGHVHIGYDNPSIKQTQAIIKAMDLYLGIPALFLDTDDRRRQYYGKAGTCRPKSYGVEYRSLSNFWLSSKERMEWVFTQTQRAVNHALSGEKILNVRNIINEINRKQAEKIISKHKLVLV